MAVTIYGMVTNPVLKTMALGGVATGRQKANDVATAVEIIRQRGCIPTEIAQNTALITYYNKRIYVHSHNDASIYSNLLFYQFEHDRHGERCYGRVTGDLCNASDDQTHEQIHDPRIQEIKHRQFTPNPIGQPGFLQHTTNAVSAMFDWLTATTVSAMFDWLTTNTVSAMFDWFTTNTVSAIEYLGRCVEFSSRVTYLRLILHEKSLKAVTHRGSISQRESTTKQYNHAPRDFILGHPPGQNGCETRFGIGFWNTRSEI